jgi:hypothetical protein
VLVLLVSTVGGCVGAGTLVMLGFGGNRGAAGIWGFVTIWGSELGCGGRRIGCGVTTTGVVGFGADWMTGIVWTVAGACFTSGRLGCGVRRIGCGVATGAAGCTEATGAEGVRAVGGAMGAPTGGLLSFPQRKICVDISRMPPPEVEGPAPRMVIISPLSTACT